MKSNNPTTKETDNEERLVPVMTYYVPVSYTVYGHSPVTGRFRSAEEALAWADENVDYISLPDDGEYMVGSFEVDMDGVVLDGYGGHVERT